MSFCIYDICLHSGKVSQVTKFATTIAVLLLLNTNAIADVILSAEAGSNLGGSPATQTGNSGSVSNSYDVTLRTDRAIARSSATFGELKAYTFASSGVVGNTGSFPTSTASFRDDWLFNAPEKTGTRGFVDVKFTIDGTLEALRSSPRIYSNSWDPLVRAIASFTFSAGDGNGGINKTESLRTSEYAAFNGVSTRFGSLLGIEQTFTVPFIYGTKLENVSLELRSRALSIGDFDFTSMSKSDLAAKWGGFSAVRDANGNIVSDYSFSSGSGFDYTLGISAVPEPGSLALMAVGAGFFLVRRTKFLRKKK